MVNNEAEQFTLDVPTDENSIYHESQEKIPDDPIPHILSHLALIVQDMHGRLEILEAVHKTGK